MLSDRFTRLGVTASTRIVEIHTLDRHGDRWQVCLDITNTRKASRYTVATDPVIIRTVKQSFAP
jgi:hypothetical protein